ncbi:VIT1/CCC1 transporter family protein [Acidiluteibacter ferrifornacis]|uniref:VIT family protein n=1 Tax=Acidiluteibacter ferrifornacis TaxID=2692424 RepID=A0A6N9NLP9_9FLAO|nr:VIT1/CCC1 transporter family protein [Acidiluteibacter ferrifornacis]NBG66814.1 hypothetical protein [Acidiluteibacter ferrifornacis]
MAEEHREYEYHNGSKFWDKWNDYIGEFVYGGIDGSVTTFAVVAGAAGANLDSSVVIILGFANLIADGFAMSVGSYLSNKSELERFEKHEQVEYWEVEHLPEKEREEVKEIYAAKGFEGELLEKVVDVITANKKRWVDVMMKEELGMIKEEKSPIKMGAVTFISFIVVGFIPLLVYVLDYLSSTKIEQPFLVAILLTSVAFMLIGWLKSSVNQTNPFRSIIETLMLGAFAAGLSFLVGDVLAKMF